MSELNFKNVVTLHNSGSGVDTAVMIGDKESPKLGLTQILSETLIPKASSKQAFTACKDYAEAFGKLASKNPSEVISVYQKDYEGNWQLARQIERGKVANYVNQVIAFRDMLANLDRDVTEYSVQTTNPSEHKKRGKRSSGGISEDVFDV